MRSDSAIQDPVDQREIEDTLKPIAIREFVLAKGTVQYGEAATGRLTPGSNGTLLVLIDKWFGQIIARWDYRADAPIEKRLSGIEVFGNGRRLWPDERDQMLPRP